MPNPIRNLPRSWSSTLCLPKSTFPPRALIADRPRYLKACTDDLYAESRRRIFKAVQEGGQIPKEFVVHDGPPYANGSLHIGHALNKILKDITNRFQVSLGNVVEYKPGWDCHGLPIELKALQKAEESGILRDDRQLDAVQIRDAARKLAASTVEEQKMGFREWGIMADWDNAWTTMDKEYELKQLEVFRKMVTKGLIHRRFKPVYWSPSTQTALAEAELEYKQDHMSTAAFIKFPLIHVGLGIERKANINWRDVSALIWTTTPWTLPANRVIAVHSDLEYVVVVSPNHGMMLLAKSRLHETEKLCKESFTPVQHESIKGSDLSGAMYHSPWLDKHSPPSPILHADFVTSNSGSGMVHCSPNHGMDDYKLCQQHGIDVFAGVDDQGCFTKDAWPSDPEALAGKAVLSSGNKTVLQLLTKHQAVVATHKYIHKYPYDWRSKKPVIVRATEQWFADVGEIREEALKSLDAVRFIPEGGKERLSSFLHHRSEWCISRQRAWGVPIPALHHKGTGKAVLDAESVSHVIALIKERGVDAWWTDDESDPSWTPLILREESGETLYRRGKDTMDVWFDSGTSWTQIGSPSGQPEAKRTADLYLEGSDQHRGWFQSSLLTSIACQSSIQAGDVPCSAPYKTLITHGFTLDQNSRKMSKSEGNVISPSQIMDGTLLPPIKQKKTYISRNSTEQPSPRHDALGPDSLRLWAAGCDYTKDVVVGESVLQAIHNSLSKFRVTFKLLIGLLCKAKQEPLLPFSEFGIIDQMALIQLRRLEQNVRRYYETYDYHRVVAALNQYVNSNFSAFYMESIKDRMYADAMDSESRAQAIMVLSQIYRGLSSTLAPITPLLVEEARWHMVEDSHGIRHVGSSLTDITGDIHGRLDTPGEIQLERDMPYLQLANVAVKAAQESARAAKKMGSSLESCVFLEIQGNSRGSHESELTAKSLLARYIRELDDLFVVSKVEMGEGLVPPHVSTAKWTYSSSFSLYDQTTVAHIYAAQQEKCVRCWKYTVPTESDLEEALCQRCVGVLEGMREDMPDLFQDHPHLDAAAMACRQNSHGDLYQSHWQL